MYSVPGPGAGAAWNNYYGDLAQLLRWKLEGNASAKASTRVTHGALPHRHLPLGALLSPCTMCGTPQASTPWRDAKPLERLVVLEVGTMFGGAADRLMRHFGAQIELFVVDPFLAYQGYERDPLHATATPRGRRSGSHMVHCHTVHLPLGALLSPCTTCVAQAEISLEQLSLAWAQVAG